MHRIIASCDICQRVKLPNSSLDMKERNHAPSKPGELCSINLYGPLPTGRGGVRYILVCFEVFSRYAKLYSLKTATTRSCLNKLVKHYFVEEVKHKVTLSDIGTQFQPPLWKVTMQNHDFKVRYSAFSHWKMHDRNFKELRDLLLFQPSKVGRIPHIELWLNNTVAGATLYTLVESVVFFGAEGNNWGMNKLFVSGCLPGCTCKPADRMHSLLWMWLFLGKFRWYLKTDFGSVNKNK